MAGLSASYRPRCAPTWVSLAATLLSLRLCSTSDERQSGGERAAQGGCSVCIWLGRFHRTLSSPSEAPEEVVAPRRRVGIFFCVFVSGRWQS